MYKTILNIIISLILILFLLISCGVKESTSPNGGTSPGGKTTSNYMSFDLSNSGGPVDITNSLSRAGNYGLTVRRENDAPLQTEDYTFSAIPTDAITINVTRPNSIDFIVNNTSASSVRITATHRDDTSITETLVLSLAPRADFMNFVLTNRSGTVTTTALARGSSYGLTINPTSASPLQTADYDITFSPVGAITGIATNTNAMSFMVNNTSDRTVTITATHKSNSVITGALILNLREPNTTLNPFATDIQSDTVPNLAGANALTREVLEPLGATTGATLVKRYATESGAGSRDGSSWANAWAGANLRTAISSIADANANRIYLVMVAGGTYKPTSGTSRSDNFKMKNHVAIMGGFKAGGGWERTGTTIFSGDINTVGNNLDNSYHVFHHDNLSLSKSHLYGVVIANGNANGLGNEGGGAGMFNSVSSPTLTRVVFSNNTANNGGGMYNTFASSTVLKKVQFISNNAQDNGGGVYNNFSAVPVFNDVIFNGNTASNGGGMYNWQAHPTLINVVFNANSAINLGGGLYSYYAKSVTVGGVFRGNSAINGGGVYEDNDGVRMPLIANAIFSDNTATGRGPDIAMDRSGRSFEDMSIAGLILGIEQTRPTEGVVAYNGTASVRIYYHYLTNTAVNFAADITTAGITYPTIGAGSSAINLGVYVRRNGSGDTATYYFSEDNITWYTGFSSTGGWGSSGTPPADAEDLSARDITGKARTGRPDAGVYELQ